MRVKMKEIKPKAFIEEKDEKVKCHNGTYTLGTRAKAVNFGVCSLINYELKPKEIDGPAFFIFGIGTGGKRLVLSDGEVYYNLDFKPKSEIAEIGGNYPYGVSIGYWQGNNAKNPEHLRIDNTSRRRLLCKKYQKLIKEVIKREINA